MVNLHFGSKEKLLLAVAEELSVRYAGQWKAIAVNPEGSRLAAAGLEHHHSTVVGDNQDRMEDAIRLALARADAVIITGGLGPTQDDITREAIAEATGRPLQFSEEYADRLRRWWASRGREMPESNLKQAEYPAGADLLENPKGTAPAIRLVARDTVIYAVPGVPPELEALLDLHVIPDLRDRSAPKKLVTAYCTRSVFMLMRLIKSLHRHNSRILLACCCFALALPAVAADPAIVKVKVDDRGTPMIGAQTPGLARSSS